MVTRARPERRMTRRDCLAWLARAAAAGGALCLECARGEERPPAAAGGAKKVANLIALKNEAAREIADPALILVRTAKGVAAFPRTCTHRHQPLAVDERSGTIYCPTHGSQFDLEGKPTGGPASRRLAWYKTTLDDDGDIRVDTTQKVEAGAWAPLPDWAKAKQVVPAEKP